MEAEPGDRDFGKLVVCECKRAEREARRMERLVGQSGLLASEAAVTLDQVVGRGRDTRKMVELARRFVAKPWGFLTLWGGYGNGKTLVLQAIVNEMRDAGVPSAYVRLADILAYLRDGFRDWTEQHRYELLRDIEVLAIDEMDGARMTGYAWEFRSKFLDDRYRRAVEGTAHTIFAMNVDPETLPGDIWDRLRDGRFRVFENRDASLRPSMRRVSVGVARGACDSGAIRAVLEVRVGAARGVVSRQQALSAGSGEVGGNGDDHQRPPDSEERGGE